jgi:ATP-dependent DNA helicase RecQ
MLTDILKKYWGYDSFLPLQEPAMSCVMEDRDSLVVLPTGGGKSLCYQAPALCREGLAVVVSPLIALMKDQVDALHQCGVEAAFINSTQTLAEKQAVAFAVRQRAISLLYIAPERLVQEQTIDFLKSTDISFIAIDEAHCISEWGHDFRPSYRGLRTLRDEFPHVAIHAFTATATEHVRDDVVEQLGLRNPEVLVGSFDRPNLVYRCERIDGRVTQIREVLQRHPRESGIIYTTTRAGTEELSDQLNGMGHRTLPYHAGMSDEDRRQNQEAFKAESIDTIIATVAFGMGIDKSNVRYVIHAGMPSSLENYQQESGRAGRDSLEAECVLFYSMGDYARWKQNVENSTGNIEAMRKSLRAMVDYSTGVVCRHRSLVQYFGQTYEAESCNACDVCLGELDLVEDALIVGQKILSSVIRQGQNFGSEYTALVLKGSSDQKVVRNGHNRLSTWGLLKDESQQAVRDWIEQLVSQDFLERVQKTGMQGNTFSILGVTPHGRELLKGEVTPRLMRAAETKKRESKRAERLAVSWEGVDRELFDELRILRHDIAVDASVPAYVVFTDESLRGLARVRPSSLEGMRDIRGIGEKKLADYGETFLNRILEHSQASELPLDNWPASTSPDERPVTPGRPATVARSAKPRSMEMFREGASIKAVADETGRAESTVGGYLVEFIQAEGIVDPTGWVDPADFDRVSAAAGKFGTERLKPIYESFEGKISYDTIRIAIECLRNQSASSS